MPLEVLQNQLHSKITEEQKAALEVLRKYIRTEEYKIIVKTAIEDEQRYLERYGVILTSKQRVNNENTNS